MRAHVLVVNELQRQTGAGQRRAQLVAQGQQQLSLAVQHPLDFVRHAVDAIRKPPELVLPPNGNPVVELPFADPAGAQANVLQRVKQPPHRKIAAADNNGDHRIDIDAQHGHVFLGREQDREHGNARHHDEKAGDKDQDQAHGKRTPGFYGLAGEPFERTD